MEWGGEEDTVWRDGWTSPKQIGKVGPRQLHQNHWGCTVLCDNEILDSVTI
jgi:hypothetical protein